MVTGIIGGIGVSSVLDTIIGNSAKAETIKVLLKNMTQSAQGAEKLYNVVDQATNKQNVFDGDAAFKKIPQGQYLCKGSPKELKKILIG